MATWIGADQNDFHGAAAVASGWFERARRLLEPLPPARTTAGSRSTRATCAHAAGDGERRALARARRRTSAAASASPDLEMLGLALEGASLVARRARAARACGGWTRRPRPRSTAAPRSRSPARGRAAFSSPRCLAVYDFERAFAWSDRIAAFADRYGSRWMLAFCRAEYGAVQRWRGRWARGRGAAGGLDRGLRPLAPRVGARPARRPGRAAPPPGPHRPRRWRCSSGPARTAQLCHARIALDRGDTRAAAELAERLLRRTRRRAPARPRRPRSTCLVRARAEGSDPAAASRAARAGASWRGRRRCKAVADRAEGVARGDRGAARGRGRRLRAAGAPYEAAEARLELARRARRAGRGDAAARERDAASRALRELGARPRRRCPS